VYLWQRITRPRDGYPPRRHVFRGAVLEAARVEGLPLQRSRGPTGRGDPNCYAHLGDRTGGHCGQGTWRQHSTAGTAASGTRDRTTREERRPGVLAKQLQPTCSRKQSSDVLRQERLTARRAFSVPRCASKPVVRGLRWGAAVTVTSPSVVTAIAVVGASTLSTPGHDPPYRPGPSGAMKLKRRRDFRHRRFPLAYCHPSNPRSSSSVNSRPAASHAARGAARPRHPRSTSTAFAIQQPTGETAGAAPAADRQDRSWLGARGGSSLRSGFP
jgi:hypothetical protein